MGIGFLDRTGKPKVFWLGRAAVILTDGNSPLRLHASDDATDASLATLETAAVCRTDDPFAGFDLAAQSAVTGLEADMELLALRASRCVVRVVDLGRDRGGLAAGLVELGVGDAELGLVP